jgi:hypothetical protein
MSVMSCATFRTPGNVTTLQNLFVIYNNGSNRIVQIRRMVLQADVTGVLVATMPLFKLCRISGYTGGQALTKVPWTATASHADIQVRGRNNSDAGTQTNIVATVGETMWQQYATRLASNVGQVLGEDNNIAPGVSATNPIVLRQGEGLLVYVETPAGTVNPNTNHYFVQCAWSEVTP